MLHDMTPKRQLSPQTVARGPGPPSHPSRCQAPGHWQAAPHPLLGAPTRPSPVSLAPAPISLWVHCSSFIIPF